MHSPGLIGGTGPGGGLCNPHAKECLGSWLVGQNARVMNDTSREECLADMA